MHWIKNRAFTHLHEYYESTNFILYTRNNPPFPPFSKMTRTHYIDLGKGRFFSFYFFEFGIFDTSSEKCIWIWEHWRRKWVYLWIGRFDESCTEFFWSSLVKCRFVDLDAAFRYYPNKWHICIEKHGEFYAERKAAWQIKTFGMIICVLIFVICLLRSYHFYYRCKACAIAWKNVFFYFYPWLRISEIHFWLRSCLGNSWAVKSRFGIVNSVIIITIITIIIITSIIIIIIIISDIIIISNHRVISMLHRLRGVFLLFLIFSFVIVISI